MPRGAGRPHVNSGRSTGPCPFKQIGSHTARVYRTKGGLAIIDPRSGLRMLIPQGMSMANTVRIERTFNGFLVRDDVAVRAFSPDGIMDFQRTYSTLRDKDGKTLIDQRFIAVGNYNFGVYAAAPGMSLGKALAGAAGPYMAQTRSAHGGNRRNADPIVSGYRDYQNGKVGD